MTKLYKTLILILLLGLQLHAQDKVSLGISGIYNFPLQNIGMGIRVQMPVTERISLVPQIKYTPSFNTIHEVYGGINLHYSLLTNTFGNGYIKKTDPQRPVLYLAVGVEYNRWINYEKTKNLKADKDNILPEAGLGMSLGSNFIRAFAEGKYNILWKESYGEIGVLFYPFNTKQNRRNNCPKIY